MDSIEKAIQRLNDLGVDVSDIYQDYNKIPLEDTDLDKVEKKVPKKSKVVKKHNIIVDSRQRDYTLYPTPSNYLVNLYEPHRNVERIELIAAMLPKTEYNVNTENNLILLTINGLTEQLTLTEGQYLIGSNQQGNVNYTSNGVPVVTGLLCELKRVLNQHTFSNNNFNVFLATVPDENGGTGNNASVLNRIVITNSSVSFSIDFTNNNYISGSPFRLLGFLKQNYNSILTNKIYGNNNNGSCTSVELQNGTEHTININSIIGVFDYDLKDDPKYIIMEVEFGGNTAERIESIDTATNQKFAVVIYDANEPDNIQTFNSTTNGGSVTMSISRPPGRLKALKGSDFDKKVIKFEPSITLENFKISFYKYDNTYYDFHNREHLLSFEFDVAEYNPENRF